MIYKRGKWYWMDDVVNGIRYREPLKTKNWQEAKQREKEELSAIAEGKSSVVGGCASSVAFNAAADSYIEYRKLRSAEKTFSTDSQRSKPLRACFGDLRLKRITADGIAKYQSARAKAGIGGRTINMEVGLLRRILKKYKQWSRLADSVEMLPEHPKEARVLTPEEKEILLQTARLKPEWMIAKCAAVLALNTTMRGCELKGLRLMNIDLFQRVLNIKRHSTKTDAGARVIPLNRDAVLSLSELIDRLDKLGVNKPVHYLFPACENGHIDPTRPTKGWRTAWRSLTKKAGLKGLRFHDLRHHCITELAELGLSDQTIMSIAGHVSREMLDHYSHIRLAAKRKALEALETPIPQNQPTQESLPAMVN
jgi:integrase